MVKVTIEFDGSDYDPTNDTHDPSPIHVKGSVVLSRSIDQMNGPSFAVVYQLYLELIDMVKVKIMQ